MYIKNISLLNQGPIKTANYDFVFKDEKPMPVVITGINGSGKTLLVSHLLNSYINLKSRCFNEIPEADAGKLYRIQSNSYSSEDFNYINVEFSDGHYSEISINDVGKFVDNIKEGTMSFKHLKVSKNSEAFQSDISKLQAKNFDDVFLYFPVDRFYSPAWLNQSNQKIVINANAERFYGKNYDNCIINNLLEGVNEYILDLILDEYLYDSQKNVPITKDGKITFQNVHTGPNRTIHETINSILSDILKAKDDSITSARFGVSSKERRTISIIATKSGKEYEYADSFYHLSSGEVFLFSLAINIIKNAGKFKSCAEIKGIVIVDEIDENLHISFCKNVVPLFIKKFPGIQFIVTTHSPFFLLGMKETFQDNYRILLLPKFVENDIYNYGEVKKMYDVVNKDYASIIEENTNLKNKLIDFSKPVIVCEGKTDIKHLKYSLKRFQDQQKFLDVDVDFYDEESCTGNKKMFNMLKSISQYMNNKNKIIGIFDCDDESISGEPGIINELGNNVYVLLIPNPLKLPGGISIEQLYSKENITTMDNDGRRLYLSNEFDEHCRLKTNLSIICDEKNKIKEYYEIGKVKVIDKNVFDEENKNLALSKNQFIEHIINNDKGFGNFDFSNFEIIWKEIQQQIVSIKKTC